MPVAIHNPVVLALIEGRRDFRLFGDLAAELCTYRPGTLHDAWARGVADERAEQAEECAA